MAMGCFVLFCFVLKMVPSKKNLAFINNFIIALTSLQ